MQNINYQKEVGRLELQGEVVEVIYKNEINSYCIAVFKLDKDSIKQNIKKSKKSKSSENEQIELEYDNSMEEEMLDDIFSNIDSETTIVGYLPFVNIGDTLKVVGKFVEHPEYGTQFKVDTFEKLMPQTTKALENYLANCGIKGVGPATARNIVDMFGEDTINVFKFEPIKLAQVKGISKEKAIDIANTFVENWEVWQLVGFLDKFGIGPQNAEKIYKELGANAIDEIENNPYILVDLVNKVNFEQIDKMALDLGFEYNNEKRIRSGIKHALILMTYNGHCCTKYESLVEFVKKLLSVNENDIEEAIISMKAKEDLVLEERNEEEWVYLYQYYKAEENVARRLLDLDRYTNIKKIDKFEKELKLFEKKSSIELSEKQLEAIRAINENNVCIITGGPGTGKTTIIKTIIDIFKHNEMKPVLCAPTGRAAKKMSEATENEASTLHRLLEIGKISDENQGISTDISVAPIDGDIVIVDEMSMVDIFLMNYLCKALYKGTKLVLVGDIDQLPSVGPGNVLKDIIESEKITTIRLNKIFRQAAKSKIIVNAHRVNEGEGFITKEEIEDLNNTEANAEFLNDFFYIDESSKEKILYNVLSLSGERLKNYGDYDFFKSIQIITPTKKGDLGTKELNKLLQNTVNPEQEGKKEKKFGDSFFREGDRIMQIKNNYDIYWEKKEPYFESGSGVFNGEFGTIDIIDDFNKQVKIKFDDDKQVWYQYSELEQIEHAYAITVHKAQRKRI
jgi:exodeoxyribonuclease V alpha subunit